MFGREPIDESLELVMNELKRMRYSGYFHQEVRFTLCELFLANRTPYARSLTADCLEELRARPVPNCLKEATYMISHALVSLGVMSCPLSPYVKKPRKKLLEEHHSLSEEWFSWCKRWFETSTLRPTTRRSHFYRLLVAEALAPRETPSGRSPRSMEPSISRRVHSGDQPNEGGSICRRSSPVLCEWPYFSHVQVCSCSGITPFFAGLNLTQEDIPRSRSQNITRHPLELLRALSLVWLFAGLGRDEISRLRVGCVRWNSSKKTDPKSESVCLLEVPLNKTSG